MSLLLIFFPETIEGTASFWAQERARILRYKPLLQPNETCDKNPSDTGQPMCV
jgi:hypothetical protein